jgi:hypothetical protein
MEESTAIGDATDPVSGEFVYAYKPSVLGAAHEFGLDDRGLSWRVGGRSGHIPYADIRRVRLAFRPMTMQTYRFVAEIWSSTAPKLLISSTSWRSMVEQERLDASYVAFISELHRRLAVQRVPAAFQAGTLPFVYWMGLVLFVVVALALAALTVRALQAGAVTGALFVVVFLGAFLWQAGAFFRRNRPGTYAPDAIPSAVLPRRQ